MKTAICISGHIRNFVQNFSNFKTFIIDPLSPDIFLHTWDTYGWRAEGNDISKGFGQFKGFDYYSGKINIEQINSLYQLKKYVVEDFSTVENQLFEQSNSHRPNCTHPCDRPENVVGMAYKLKKCFELKIQHEKENNFVYDVVIRSRPDLLFSRAPINDKVISAVQNGYLLTPEEESYGKASDIFAIGNSETMNRYSELYNNLDDMNSKKCDMNPHGAMKYYFDSKFPNTWTKNSFGIVLNRCRNVCENKIQCSSCDPNKKILSNIF